MHIRKILGLIFHAWSIYAPNNMNLAEIRTELFTYMNKGLIYYIGDQGWG